MLFVFAPGAQVVRRALRAQFNRLIRTAVKANRFSFLKKSQVTSIKYTRPVKITQAALVFAAARIEGNEACAYKQRGSKV